MEEGTANALGVGEKSDTELMSMKTLLIDVDSVIPNLALMHISTWKKGMGNEVGFSIPEPDEVYASCVFKKNKHLVDGLQFFYPKARIDVGGGGGQFVQEFAQGS